MAGRVYVHPQLVGGADVRPDGAAHLDAVARWLQDAAFADGLDAGLGSSSGWVIRRTSLRVERLPRFAERLELRTWCAGAVASIAERRTTISGVDGASVEAEAIWVHIDPATRRPASFPPAFLEAYGEGASNSRPRTRLRHQASPPEGAASWDWTFTGADLDYAGHVNNAVYWRLLEAALEGAAPPEGGVSLEAEYRAGMGAGRASVRQDEGRLWVSDPAGALAATLASDAWK